MRSGRQGVRPQMRPCPSVISQWDLRRTFSFRSLYIGILGLDAHRAPPGLSGKALRLQGILSWDGNRSDDADGVGSRTDNPRENGGFAFGGEDIDCYLPLRLLCGAFPRTVDGGEAVFRSFGDRTAGDGCG